MDIKDYLPEVRPDMVIALHACDVATDYAIYNAYRWQADYIFSVPCCQHEMNSMIKTENFSLLCAFGLLKGRFSALATDALRGKYLELCGYNVDILEFIDVEHSPKNVLIRARRSTKINDRKKWLIRSEINRFSSEFNARLAMEKLVLHYNKQFSVNGQSFSIMAGKSSMMLKDSLSIRSAVFGNEQNYRNGARRDDADDTAWFVNVYDSDGNVVATSRSAYTDNSDDRLLGKIAVLSEYRMFGLGKQMIEILEKVSKDDGAVRLCVNSQLQALGFYEKLGFTPCGKSYFDEGLEMVPVEKQI